MATVERTDTEMVTLEIDGQELRAPKGSMIIQVADQAGIDIPRFCYHDKLSIAANCRMCLVDVEKAPKPLPACATPVADGMKVFTESKRAMDAQRGVMEFLLINHPLDCPICDQGGECELQDLAMGYGRSVSRFTERKRVVPDKNLGPLVSTDMTRCIHCTRCVRFLEEIAGTAELGGVGRGEDLKISTFIERNIESELSGNIIDLCPVGALTNKPFRFSARPWEMSARPYLGTHDCVGSNLYFHVRAHAIKRAVPRDNEAVNECWLDDRDRYSHFGLQADDRVLAPRIKVDGEWRETDWDTAIEAARDGLATVKNDHGADQLGFLASPRATTEEAFLIQKLARGLGSGNIDHRLRLTDFTDPEAGRARMDMPTRDWAGADAIFLVGSNIRQDQPILGHRVRTAWRTGGAKIMDLNPVAFDFHFDLTERLVVSPQHMVETLARVARAAADLTGRDLPDGTLGAFITARSPEPSARDIAGALNDAGRGVLVLGDIAVQHPHHVWLRRLAEWLAGALDVALCVLPGAANSQGAWHAGLVPHVGPGGVPLGDTGLDTRAMLEAPRKGYFLYDLEPEFDIADPALATRALGDAEFVVAMTAFAGQDLLDAAAVILPLAPVPETDGSYVNADNQRQWLRAAVKPAGNSRPGWKILRVLGEKLGVDGFDFHNLNQVEGMLDEVAGDDAELPPVDPAGEVPAGDDGTVWRLGTVPLYANDSLVRRAPALQATHHSENAVYAVMHPATAEKLGLTSRGNIRVRQGGGSAEVPLKTDARVPPAAVWLPQATCSARALGIAIGPVEVEQAE